MEELTLYLRNTESCGIRNTTLSASLNANSVILFSRKRTVNIGLADGFV